MNQTFLELAQKYGQRLKETTIEIPIQANGRSPFPDDEILRNKTVIGMYFYNNPDGQGIIPYSDNTTPNKACLDSSYIYLMAGNVAIWQLSPLNSFQLNDVIGAENIRFFYLDNFTPSKSYLICDQSLAVSGESYFLTFIYLD